MNGAELLVKTAVNAGIEICFTNPGTTELPLVCAFDSIFGIRPVLGLFEGCCTGAADGYGRMTDKPAMTLLHLGPGLSYGLANLHNARRAGTSVLNVIGEHATWHRSADSPVTMEIEKLAGTVSGWQRTNASVQTISQDTAAAIAAAFQGQVATLIVPQDIQGSESLDETIKKPDITSSPPDQDAIEKAAELLRRSRECVLILGGQTLRKRGLIAAARIRAKTGCDILAENFPAHMERGVGIPAVNRVPYFPEQAQELLSRYHGVILVGAREPVTFFGYTGYQSRLLTRQQHVCHIAAHTHNLPEALENLADFLNAPAMQAPSSMVVSHVRRPDLPQGRLTAQNAGIILAALQPEQAIIVEEAVTSGATYYPLTAGVPPHTMLTITGGAIGYGMPCAVGAAIACPQRPVISFQADGSAMYTVQALWMQARESLNITTLICSNRSYDILKIELARAGVSPGQYAQTLTDLGNPEIDWVQISKGMGVPAVAVNSCEGLTKELRKALKEPGPHLVEMKLGS